MPPLSPRAQRLFGESAFDVLAEVQALRAQGRDIISFAIGEPDFPTPDNIVQAGIDAIRRGRTGYGPTAGIPELREAIAGRISGVCGAEVATDHVIVLPGAKPAIFHAMAACLDEGDEVIIPSPGFPVYEATAAYCGAVARKLPLREECGFAFDPDELRSLVTPQTRMVVLNSPHNPTGGILQQAHLEAVVETTADCGAWLLSDEIYARLTYDSPHISLLQLPAARDRTILVDGFSKAYRMTGWRLGYCIAPRPVIELMTTFAVNTVSCTATFTQHAGIEALQGPQDPVDEMRAELKQRRDVMVSLLNDLPGVTAPVPGGAFYVYANVTGLCRRLGGLGAAELRRRWLHEAGVAVLDQSCFGVDSADGQRYVRFSYATTIDKIRQGIRRIGAAF